jgi:hypothetical protein
LGFFADKDPEAYGRVIDKVAAQGLSSLKPSERQMFDKILRVGGNDAHRAEKALEGKSVK